MSQIAIRTGTLGVLAMGLLLAMPLVSVAAPKPPPQPLQDSVTGSGQSSSCAGIFEIDARSGPSGENPTGQATCSILITGPVSCLNVSGNVALLTVQTATFGPVGVRITDNGTSGDRLEAFPDQAGVGCATPLGFYVVFTFSGDIVVVDAPPLPTSKEQCKNGGWRNFGDTFRNQGQCVAFVQRGPKP